MAEQREPEGRDDMGVGEAKERLRAMHQGGPGRGGGRGQGGRAVGLCDRGNFDLAVRLCCWFRVQRGTQVSLWSSVARFWAE